MDLAHFFEGIVCGAVASAGFGVLFNVGLRGLPWCAAIGALALAVRGAALQQGWSFEAASFMAAVVVSFTVEVVPLKAGASRNLLRVLGCIPMIPGAFAAKAILGLFALTLKSSADPTGDPLINSLTNGLRVMFTMGALGIGLAIPTLLLRTREQTTSETQPLSSRAVQR